MTHLDIQGWFDFAPLYDREVADTRDGFRFAEVGCWLGKSTAYLARQIKDTGKPGQFWAVDHGFGSPSGSDYGLHEPTLREYGGNVAGRLVWHLRECDVLDRVAPLILPSVQAASLFPDEYFDFVFVDAAHDRESVLADLRAWWPKIKVGGRLAGHDYDDHWPPVVGAVNEFFGRENLNDPTCPHCWSVVKRTQPRPRKSDVSDRNRPKKEGYYWALWMAAAKGTHEGHELAPARDWEIVEVRENRIGPEDESGEKWAVSVNGVRETQWLDNFKWGSPVLSRLEIERVVAELRDIREVAREVGGIGMITLRDRMNRIERMLMPNV